MKNKNSIVVAVDFDSTIANSRTIFPLIGDPIEGALEGIKKLHEKGFWLIVWTCRETEEQKEHMINWLKEHNIYSCFDAVNENLPHVIESCWDARKVIADIYIDDRSFPSVDIPKFWKEDIDILLEKYV